MAYLAPKDYAEDPSILESAMRKMMGDLDLDWMGSIRERAAFQPSDPRRGLTLDDINQGTYGPDQLPDRIRRNFSMAPRGAILPKGLPSLGYTLNRKSDIWSDKAASIFEEAKSRHWAPARDIPWSALDGIDATSREERSVRQICTQLSSVGMVASDVAARSVYRLNIEFHEVKYLLCSQMMDGARISEAMRKRALYGAGSLGVDSKTVGELLKMVMDSESFPMTSSAMNLTLFSWVQALARRMEYLARNAADARLWTLVGQDASRFLAYGIDHIGSLLRARPSEAVRLHDHLDSIDNGLVGVLGASEVIEPLVLLSGGLPPVATFYGQLADEYFARCHAAGLEGRRERSPVTDFVNLVSRSSP